MTTTPSRQIGDVDRCAEQALAVALARSSHSASPDAISFRSWTPDGVRTKRKRRFTLIAVDGVPILVSKMPMDPDDPKVAGEFAKLSTLAAPPALRHPRPVEATGDGFIMTYAPTVDLPDALVPADRASFEPLLTQTVVLISELHTSCFAANEPPTPEEVAHAYVSDPVDDNAPLRAALDRGLLGPTHGDLAPWNVRVDTATGRLSIIDWEDYRTVGYPAIDLLNLLVTLGLVVFPEYRERGVDWLYDQVLESDHWYALLLRDLVCTYATLTRQPAHNVINLLPFFCQWLITRIEREGRDASELYYGSFLTRYITRPPTWVGALSADD